MLNQELQKEIRGYINRHILLPIDIEFNKNSITITTLCSKKSIFNTEDLVEDFIQYLRKMKVKINTVYNDSHIDYFTINLTPEYFVSLIKLGILI